MTLQGHPPVWPLNLITEFGAVVPLSFFFCYVYSSHTQTPPRHEACPRVLHVPFGTVVPLSIHMLISFLLIAQVFYSNSYFLYARWWFSVLSLRSFVQKNNSVTFRGAAIVSKIHKIYELVYQFHHLLSRMIWS